MRKVAVILLVLIITANIFPKVLRVPINYSSIQSALDAASDYDTVLVDSGKYIENLVWPLVKGLSLISNAGPEKTVIEAVDSCPVCAIDSCLFEVVKISGFTFCKGIVFGM